MNPRHVFTRDLDLVGGPFHHAAGATSPCERVARARLPMHARSPNSREQASLTHGCIISSVCLMCRAPPRSDRNSSGMPDVGSATFRRFAVIVAMAGVMMTSDARAEVSCHLCRIIVNWSIDVMMRAPFGNSGQIPAVSDRKTVVPSIETFTQVQVLRLKAAVCQTPISRSAIFAEVVSFQRPPRSSDLAAVGFNGPFGASQGQLWGHFRGVIVGATEELWCAPWL
jgi:hypothetical protein